MAAVEPYQQLERAWAKFNGLDAAGMVVCSSGTAALHLALEAFRLPPGSEVIVPDFTMIACARAVSMAGMTPVFVDCDERLLMDGRLALQAAAGRARAIMFVHIYGRRCQTEDVQLAETMRGDGAIIEDLAEAHGVRPGPFTKAACWSFYKNKIVAGEEGGAVWFCDPAHARLARSLRNHGFTETHDFTHVPRGCNHRLSNANAELVLRSLSQYEESLVRRRMWEAICDERCPAEWRMPPRDAPWVYDLRISGLERWRQDSIVAALNRNGIRARHAFKPLSRQEEYEDCRRVSEWRGDSAADCAAREVIYLPLDPGVEHQPRLAFDVIRSCL